MNRMAWSSTLCTEPSPWSFSASFSASRSIAAWTLRCSARPALRVARSFSISSMVAISLPRCWCRSQAGPHAVDVLDHFDRIQRCIDLPRVGALGDLVLLADKPASLNAVIENLRVIDQRKLHPQIETHEAHELGIASRWRLLHEVSLQLRQPRKVAAHLHLVELARTYRPAQHDAAAGTALLADLDLHAPVE